MVKIAVVHSSTLNCDEHEYDEYESIGSLRKFLESENNYSPELRDQTVIQLYYENRCLDDTEIIGDVIYQGNSSLREFYALHNEVGKFTSETNFKLDEKSKAALRSFEGNLDEQSVMAYSSILHYGGLIETAKNMEPSSTRTESATVAAREAGPEIQWFNWKVLSRLVIGFFMFAQGASYSRMITFVVAATIYYFIEIGAFRVLMKSIVQRQQQHLQQQQQQQQEAQASAAMPAAALAAAATTAGAPVNGQNAQAEEAAGPAAGPAGAGRHNAGQRPAPAGVAAMQLQVSHFSSPGGSGLYAITAAGAGLNITSLLLHMSQDGITVPRTGGLLMDLAAFGISLVCSLLPHWDVNGPHGMNAIAGIAAP